MGVAYDVKERHHSCLFDVPKTNHKVALLDWFLFVVKPQGPVVGTLVVISAGTGEKNAKLQMCGGCFFTGEGPNDVTTGVGFSVIDHHSSISTT